MKFILYIIISHYHLLISGYDTSTEIADLVSKTFRNIDQDANHEGGMISGILKVMGLEGRKISAIAVNSIVLISQLVRALSI